MTIFVDASALISMIAGEADADPLSDRLDSEPVRLCSTLALWETMAGLCRSHRLSPTTAKMLATDFLTRFNIVLVPIGEREFDVAASAYERFGKGRHAAALNMGDCFAYACAKAHKAKLLFKGIDFPQTDIEIV